MQLIPGYPSDILCEIGYGGLSGLKFSKVVTKPYLYLAVLFHQNLTRPDALFSDRLLI